MDSEPLAGMPARFRKVPYRAVRDTSLPAGALRLLIAISCGADSDGECLMETTRLAAEVGLTPDDIGHFSRQLAAAGYLAAELEDTSWRYRLVTEPERANGAARKPVPAAAGAGRPKGINRMLRAWRVADRFSFWLRTVVAPDETDLFWSWALRNEDDYHGLVQRFGEADDETALEALLGDALAAIAESRGVRAGDAEERRTPA
ncbi:MAG: hypothetical protein HKM95_13635 [Inquilinus sp.]|nr:hypothetical protein [Inquilinus sp.]